MSSKSAVHQQHIAQWRVSGMSRAAYCRQHGIVYHTTRRWSRPAEPPEAPQHASSGFIEVLRPPAVITSSPASEVATVSWPTGAMLRIPTGTDPHWIGRLIAAVRPC
jgi:hypothetical protein